MRLTFLGTCAADVDRAAIAALCPDHFDPDHRRYAAALLEEHILIDCGPMVLDSLRILGIDPAGITDLVVTHTHADHIACDAIAVVAGARPTPLHIWCEKDAVPRVSGVPNTVIHPLTAGQTVSVGGVTVTALAANHYVEGSPETPLHYLFEKDGRKLFYGCDGAWLRTPTYNHLVGKQIDLFIFDGTVGDYEGDERMACHNSIPMIRLMLRSMRARDIFAPDGQIYLSHMAHTLHRPYRETQEILARDGLFAARDGLTLEI